VMASRAAWARLVVFFSYIDLIRLGALRSNATAMLQQASANSMCRHSIIDSTVYV
jgi:hypothetical protein